MAANIAAVAAASQEVDPVLKKAIKLLHSSNPTSAAELRLLLDEALKIRFGPEKMISKNLSQRMLDDEANFPGRATPQPPAQPMATSDEIINLTNSPEKVPADSPDTIADSEDGSGLAMSGVVNTGDTGDFCDLNCCVCGEMVFTATNRLIECSKCGSLYHQECHKPPISNEEAADDQENIWQCDTCCNKPSTSRTAVTTAISSTPTVVIPDDPMPMTSKAKSSVPSSRSSTSSNSSSPFYKPEPSSSTNASSSSSSKHGHKSSSSSSSKSHREERASKSVAPSLSAISAPEKHSSSSGGGSSSSRRGNSSTKSSSSKSKHHESSSSSSSKRRNK
ncbi:hypothetical protein KR222_005745 [Zaprionus bogoriensis]|nr:hypothetical protein KR222_005745 [Zaprionus bogoriensis]